MKRESVLLKNTIILGIGTFLPKFASFAILPILTGYLTQEEYGIYDLINVLVSLFLPAVTLQIQTAAFRFLIDVRGNFQDEQKVITNIFAYTIPVSIVALAILAFVLNINSKLEILFMCVYFAIDIIANTERQIVRGLSKNINYSVSAILGSVGQLIFVIVFVLFFKSGLLGAIVALAVSAMCESLYLFLSAKLYLYIKIDKIDAKYIKKLLKYSWPMVPNSMSMWVMRVSDRLIISLFMGVSANAVYAVANKIPSILTIAQNTFTMAWQENASIAVEDSDADNYYSKMFHVLFDFMAGAFGILISLTPILFAILIQGNYNEAYSQIPILFLGMFFFSIASYIGGIYVAYKRTVSVGVTTIVSAMCNLLINLLFINKIGLYAASGSTLISYILLCVYRMTDIKKIIDIEYNYKHLIEILFVLIGMSCLCMFQSAILNWINFVIAILFYFLLNGKITIKIAKKIFKCGLGHS